MAEQEFIFALINPNAKAPVNLKPLHNEALQKSADIFKCATACKN